MPPQYCCGLYNADRIQERGTQPIKPNEDQSVHGCEAKPRRGGPPQHIQLVPENHNLGLKPSPRLEQRHQDGRQQFQIGDHRASHYLMRPQDPARMRFPVGTSARRRPERSGQYSTPGPDFDADVGLWHQHLKSPSPLLGKHQRRRACNGARDAGRGPDANRLRAMGRPAQGC
jgi:hypothetical protein